MRIAMIGLGRMGGNMARRLARRGIAVEGFDALATAREALAGEPGVRAHGTLAQAVAALGAPRIVWLMLPAGAATDAAIDELLPALQPGDVLVDGANANYRDSQARAARMAARGLRFADCGVSGGVWGLANGYCLMFGTDPDTMAMLAPIARALAPDDGRGVGVGDGDDGDGAGDGGGDGGDDGRGGGAGWLHCGAHGAGHFTKMIHNGIEYGMMQSLAEGFALLEGRSDLALDSAAIARLWRHGSVIRSWLLDLTADALAVPGAIASVAPLVADSGEGRWTVEEAVRQGTPAPVIAMALMTRFDSQGRADTANRLLSLMRKGFGGHPVVREPQP